MKKWIAALPLALLAALTAASAQTLPRAAPEEVGLSSERLGRITETIRADISKGLMPGAVLLVARHGKIAYLESLGQRDPGTSAAMTADTIFRLYSMTKPITSVAAMMLVEDGRLALDEPVSKYIPAFATQKVAMQPSDAPAGPVSALDLVPARRAITIQDLLRHTSGITYGFFGTLPAKRAYLDAQVTKGNYDNSEFAERIARMPLAFQPGTTWDYSHSTDILGRVVEVVSGQSLYGFAKARILDPLGMSDTSFTVPDAAKQARIAEPFPADRVFGQDAEFSEPRQPSRYESGGGGMVGTASDYARFLQMLLAGGTLDGKRYLGPRTIAYMTADHAGPEAGIAPGPYYLPGPGYGFGLGFAVRRTAGASPLPGSAGEYNWGGVGGTYFWVDPKEDMFVVLMMQSPKQRLRYRTLLRDMIYAAIEQ